MARFLFRYPVRSNDKKESSMANEFSAQLTHILQLSREEARRFRNSRISARHLLLGLIRDGNNAALNALRALGVSLDTLRYRAEQASSEQASADTLPEAGAAFDASVTRILRLSFLEARLARVSEAGAEHLLLAILRDQENDGRRMLIAEGADYEKLSQRLHRGYAVSDNFGTYNETEEPEDFPHSGDNSKSTRQQTNNDKDSDTPVIDQYGIDLTRAAAEGKLDPVVGREKEMMRIAQILSRRKKNNPILIGEPGVGKSAIVEGLAQQIAKGEVTPSLQRKRIVMLNMANMVAGTQYRGQFEERVRRLIEEMEAHPDIILFIDEIHTIIGAGGAAGSMDAANMLKPALARGQFQCIGATTTNEYTKSIEKDGALERRFQKVMLAPTTAEETLQILRNIKERYEQHHHATYTDEALEACVKLTTRYITDRSLPDKAIDALDEAGSRKNLTSVVVPQDIHEAEQHIAQLKERKNDAARKQQYELAANLRDEAQQRERELEARKRQWQETLQSEHHVVDREDIAAVVSMMSGVPVSQMAQTENIRLKDMRKALGERIIAQDEAIERLVRSITRNRIGLKDPHRPIGTFMFVGPTGVGKTYLVKTLAEFMFGSADALIRVDMSEYGEKFSTSRLVGAPPGYVGYEEGGQLTEKVRRNPYSIILLDEIEKAHPDVFNTLLQVMDEGRLTDGNGRTVDFRNTVIVMTSNSGTRQLREFGGGIGFGSSQHATGKQAESIVRKALQRQFAPEFLNRLDDIIMFQPLNDESALKITDLELNILQARVEALGYHITFSDAARALLVKKGFDAAYGARSLKRAVQEHIEDKLTDILMDLSDTEEKTDFLVDAISDEIVVQLQENTSRTV